MHQSHQGIVTVLIMTNMQRFSRIPIISIFMLGKNGNKKCSYRCSTCGSTHNTSVFMMPTVVNSPSSVIALWYWCLISYTLHIIQPYLTSSLSKCWRQTTSASSKSQLSSQMVPHIPLYSTSTRPRDVELGGLIKRTIIVIKLIRLNPRQKWSMNKIHVAHF